MSMHKIPLTPIEESGLRSHGLDIGTPSQLSDAFRQGVAWGLSNGLTVFGWTNDKGDFTTDHVRKEKWDRYGWAVYPVFVNQKTQD